MTRDSDTRRMAETGTGSGRSPSSAGRQASHNPLGNSPYPKTVERCPFCGHAEVDWTMLSSKKYATTTCGKCGARGPLVPFEMRREPIDETTADAYAAWNTRAGDSLETPTPTGEVGEMVARIIDPYAMGETESDIAEAHQQSIARERALAKAAKIIDLLERLTREDGAGEMRHG